MFIELTDTYNKRIIINTNMIQFLTFNEDANDGVLTGVCVGDTIFFLSKESSIKLQQTIL